MGDGAHSAQFIPNAENPETLNVYGTILPGDGKRFYDVMKAAYDRGQPYRTLRLNSGGGQVIAGTEIALLTHELGLTTGGGPEDNCASICVLIFAAGAYRMHSAEGAIGVHSAATYTSGPDGPGAETDSALALTAKLTRLYKQFGTPDSITGKMVTTPGDQITWLKTDELESGGFSHLIEVSNTPLPPPTTSAPRPSNPAPTSTSFTMTCRSTASGNYYPVIVTQTGIQVGERFYTVEKSHISTSKSSGRQALVVTGKTHIGTHYTAVFGGARPRVEFANGREKATDLCD